MHTNSRGIILTLILAIVVTARPAAIFSASANGISVSLITILPGRSLYSTFGHSAIRIVNREKGTDKLYNYGLSVRPFDARFVLGMLTGHMEFMVAALNTQESFAFYSEVENRTIIEQVLNLNPAQIDALMSTLKHDTRPENRVYNYRYFSDNCATRVWELFAPLCASPEGKDAAAQPQPTLRDQLHQAMADSAWVRTVIDLLLGPAADRPRPYDAPLFLPKQLMDTAAASSVAGRSEQVPFVQSSSVVFQAKKTPASALSITPLATTILVLTASLISLFPTVGKRMLIFDAALFALATVAGACILLFWLAASYPEVAYNLNLLWANPLPLAALIVSRCAPKSHASRALSALTAALAFLCAATGGLGLQHIPAELRILALAVGVRCLSQTITPNARPASVDKATTRPT